MQILSKKPLENLDDLITQIVESETFRSAPMMRTLLLYLWKHQGDPISEYAVGIDALGRPPSFDPRTDSTVRVQISRLRAKLKEFYEASGESFPLRLSIPRGRHDLQWTYDKPAIRPAQKLDPIPRAYTVAAAAILSFLLILCVFLFFRVHRLESEPVASAPPLPHLWRSFITGTQPVQIIIPSPLYFFWPERGVNVRDLNVSDFSRWPTSPSLREMAAKWGPPTLSQNYVGVPEMNAGVRLLQYLSGNNAPVEVIESRKFGADSVARRNTIFIGMPRTAVYLDEIAQRLNFYIERVEPDVVGNRHPAAGEAKSFQQIDYSADRIRYPGIIALLPPRLENTRSLLLLGRSPGSIATMLTSADGLRRIEDQWRKGGSPESWEMVIEADTYRSDTISKTACVAFRAIPADFWK